METNNNFISLQLTNKCGGPVPSFFFNEISTYPYMNI